MFHALPIHIYTQRHAAFFFLSPTSHLTSFFIIRYRCTGCSLLYIHRLGFPLPKATEDPPPSQLRKSSTMGNGPSRYERIENFYGGQPDWDVPGLVRYRSRSERRREQSTQRPSGRSSRGPTRRRSYDRPRPNFDPTRYLPQYHPQYLPPLSPQQPGPQPARSKPGQNRGRQPSVHLPPNPYHDHANYDDYDWYPSEGEESEGSVTIVEGPRGRRGDIAAHPSSRRPSIRREPSQPGGQRPPLYTPPPSYHSQPPAAAAAPHPLSRNATASNAAPRLSGERDGADRGRSAALDPPARNPQRASSVLGSQRGGYRRAGEGFSAPGLDSYARLPSRRRTSPPPFHSRTLSASIRQEEGPMQPPVASPTPLLRRQPNFHSLATADAAANARDAVPGCREERNCDDRERRAERESWVRNPQRTSSQLGRQGERERTQAAEFPSHRRPAPPPPPPPPPPPRRSNSRRASVTAAATATATQAPPIPPKIPFSQTGTAPAPAPAPSRSRSLSQNPTPNPNPPSTTPHNQTNSRLDPRRARVDDHDIASASESESDTIDLRGAAMMDFAPVHRLGRFRDRQWDGQREG